MWEGLIDGATMRRPNARRRKSARASVAIAFAVESLECRRLLAQFAVIGDYSAGQPLLDVSNRIKSWNPAYIATVGDNWYDADPNIDATVGRYFHDYVSPYTGAFGAGSPSGNRFWPSLGNHDYDQGVQQYFNMFTLPGNERYYSVKRDNVELFIVNSNTQEPDGTGSSSTQANWLKNALAASTATWKLVLFHHPPYSSSISSDNTYMRWPFKDWGATAVLAGHHHHYERLDIGGIPYFINGLGGAEIVGLGTTDPNSKVRYNGDYGAMLIDAGTTQMNFKFITRTGAVIDNYTVNAPTPPPTGTPVTWIAQNSPWKYLDNGTNQGTAWRASSFVDSTWKTGNAELGYGDGDEATVVSFGPSSTSKYITTYFRKAFTVADAAAINSLNLKLLRDDGAVVYLNGNEVYRNNMPTGTIANTTLASSNVEDDNTFFTQAVSPALLATGNNVISVEIHQSVADSSDISFNFELSGTTTGTTVQPPAAPTGLNASAASSTQVNLTWTDASSNEAGFKVERSPDGTNNWTQIGTTNAGVATYQDLTVVANTAYFYRVRAYNAGGDSLYSNTANTTTPPAPQPPAAPTGLVASAISASQINLSWTDGSDNETGFKVERSLDGINGWTQIGTTLAGVTSYSDTGRAAGTTYHYRVRSYNAAGDSLYSNTANATTNAAPPQPQQVNYVLSGATWRYLDNGSNQGTAWRAASFNDSAWKPGASELGYGDGDEATVVSFGSSSSNKFITTYFRKSFDVADPAAVSALSYRLVRDDGAVVYLNGVEIARSNMPTGTISNTTRASGGVNGNNERQWFTGTINPALLVAGANVIAVEIHQDTPSSSDVSFNFELTGTVQPPATQPAAPSGLAATASNSSQINLSWTDNSSNESGFKIERSPNGVDGWTQIATTSAGVNTYQDLGRSPSTTYFYRVRSYNGAGDSLYSNVDDATTPAAPQAPAAPSGLAASAASSSQINLSWTDESNDETGFKIERSLNGIDGWSQIGTTLAGATAFQDTGRAPSTTYHYRVRAYNAGGDSDYSNNATATTQPSSTPTNVTVIAANSTWLYLDNGSNQGTAWRATSFNDSTWKPGAAELGYGDGDEATVVSFGPSASAKFITTYFRQSFDIANPATVTALAMRLIRDDGAVVYLNGTEVYRNNMPTGTIAYNTVASTSIGTTGETTWLTANLNPALLVSGTNVIAVEIHQDRGDSSDISMKMELVATIAGGAGAASSSLAATQPSAAKSTFSDSLISTVSLLEPEESLV
jgi:hypothetical protein